jgi:hypothetical protein
MPEVTLHAPGSFSWAELATSDPKAAKAFYAALFGWSAADTPMGPGPEDIYTRLQLAGKDVGALYRMMKEQESQGVPPNWLCYVAVESADAAANKATELGGSVVAEPFDVFTYGRMAMLRDTEGAVFAVWQARDRWGVQLSNEPGALSWCELASDDPAAAKKFYSGLFGWGMSERTDFPYTELMVGKVPVGGILPKSPELAGTPPYWTLYFQVTDCDGAAAKTKSLGGRVLFGPQDIPAVGRFAILQDPQGAAFAVIQLG